MRWPPLSSAPQIPAEAPPVRSGKPFSRRMVVDEAEHFPAESACHRRFAPTAVRLNRNTVRLPPGITVYLHRLTSHDWPRCREQRSAQFADPDKLHITRTPNRHLAFGHGIHYCVGAVLARVEGAIVISTVLRRMPNLTRSGTDFQWKPGLASAQARIAPGCVLATTIKQEGSHRKENYRAFFQERTSEE